MTTAPAQILVPVSELVADPRNARKHSRENIEAIKASLLRFGQQKPVVVGGEGHIIAGSGTLQAASELGWTHLKVERSELVGDEAIAYGIADNRTAELAEWDDTVLADLLGELEHLTGTGFSTEDLDALLAGLKSTDLLTDPDAVPAPPRTPISQLGDLWVLGPHRLRCGDSSDVGILGTLVQGQTVDMVWTDPPYGVDYVGKTKDALKIKNDQNIGEAAALWDKVVESCLLVQRKGGAWYVTVPATEGDFAASLRARGVLRQSLVWIKDRFVLGRSDYHYQHEAILYGWKPGAAHTFLGGRTLSSLVDDEIPLDDLSRDDLLALLADIRSQASIIRESRPSASPDHPTTKPVSLIERAIRNSSRASERVLDPFGGSGSTLIACERSNRVALLCELDPTYVDVIAKRWQQATGVLPIREATGEPHDFDS